ncbi:hypothetical protein Tco_1423780 [Tanacetum coccineum]
MTLYHGNNVFDCIVGKENWVNILKSIDEGHFLMGTIRDALVEGTEGAHQLGLTEHRSGEQSKGRRCSWNCTQPKRPQNSDYFKDKMLLMQAQENGVVLDEEQLLFLTADECDAFDSDVDEAPTAQTMFMANLSSADPVYDEASPSYDSDILSEVHEYDNYQDVVCEHHDAHEMHHDVQPNCVVDLNADYTSDNNMIMYDQYVKDNAEPIIQCNVSSMPNDDNL